MKSTDDVNRAMSRANYAYEEILNAIIRQDLVPGIPLTENELSIWLKVSRTPIREALNRLRAEGIVEYVRSKGFYVCHISKDRIQQIYETIEALESMVAYLLAVDHSHPDFPQVEQTIIRMEKASIEEHWDDWVIADEEFHALTHKCCTNRYIARELRLLDIPSKQVRFMITKVFIDKVNSTKSHRAVYEAIVDNNPELARSLAQKHFAWIRSEAIKILDNYNLLPHNPLLSNVDTITNVSAYRQ